MSHIEAACQDFNHSPGCPKWTKTSTTQHVAPNTILRAPTQHDSLSYYGNAFRWWRTLTRVQMVFFSTAEGVELTSTCFALGAGVTAS